jgi:hypothetical protein
MDNQATINNQLGQMLELRRMRNLARQGASHLHAIASGPIDVPFFDSEPVEYFGQPDEPKFQSDDDEGFAMWERDNDNYERRMEERFDSMHDGDYYMPRY